MAYEEVTASGLVKIDTDGNVIDPGHAPEPFTGRVNLAGFVIHSAIHSAREDAVCVMHAHPDSVVSVSAMPDGLLPVGQAYYALGDVTYHDYEGLAVSMAERETLARDIGSTSKVLMLRNHGVLTLGGTVGEAWTKMYFCIRACEHQVGAMSAGKLILPPKEVSEAATRTALAFNSEGMGYLEFEAMKRRLNRKDNSYAV